MYLKEEQRLSIKAIFDRKDMFVRLSTGQEIHAVFATEFCLSLWILSVIVWLLDTIVVSSTHLSSIPRRV